MEPDQRPTCWEGWMCACTLPQIKFPRSYIPARSPFLQKHLIRQRKEGEEKEKLLQWQMMTIVLSLPVGQGSFLSNYQGHGEGRKGLEWPRPSL